MGELHDLIAARFWGREPSWSQFPAGALQRHWTYTASRPSLLSSALRWRAQLLHRQPAPPSKILAPLTSRSRWSCFFLFLPDGLLTAAHRYTLEKLRTRDAGLCVVCATPRVTDVPAELFALVDAVIWKGLRGFDFSAYALAIEAVSSASEGADLLLLNDSVLGPFTSIDAALADMPWDLSGFTALDRGEPHIQSYAIHFRNLTKLRAAALGSVISTDYAYDRYRAVIMAQELPLARVASKKMSVGAQWFASARFGDPSVHGALALAREQFPFLKRKLFDRDAGILPRSELCSILELHRHPQL